MSGQGAVPISAATWVRETTAEKNSRFDLITLARLARCIPDALSKNEHGELVALMRSGRKVSAVVEDISAGVSADPDYAAVLSEACRWIYLEARDAETRHSLLTAELVRLWPNDAKWHEGLQKSLDGAFNAARTAYRLHVHSKGVDALKLMSDLRKGLSDDVRALTTNTSSLSSGLWRDAAVAFGVVVLKRQQPA